MNRTAAQRAAKALKHYEDKSGLRFVGSSETPDAMEEMVIRFLADLEHYSDLRFGENRYGRLFMQAHQVYLKDKPDEAS